MIVRQAHKMPRGKPEASIEERFLKRCIIDGDCILWDGNKFTNGYGQLTKQTYKTRYAHQWACHFYNGSPLPVEKGMCIKHSCDNKLCVNPDHLSYGTLQENIQEMVERIPTAMGRVIPTPDELELLKKMISQNTARREMSRKINHSRNWINRVIREYSL